MILINFVAEVELEGRSKKSSNVIPAWVKRGSMDSRVRGNDKPAALSRQHSLQSWLIRSGNVPESHLGVSRIGIYTDFT